MTIFFFMTGFERITPRAKRRPNSTFFSMRYNGEMGKNLISGGPRVMFLGAKPTDRFRKTQRIRANWTCTQDRLFVFRKKNGKDKFMAHQGLVPSHTTHNTPHTTYHTPHTTPYSSDIDPTEGPSKPIYGWASPRSTKEEAWQLPNNNRWPVRRESGRATIPRCRHFIAT